MRWLAILGVLGLVSCGGPREVVRIKQFHLRTVEVNPGEVAPIRAEMQKRLHGAVSTAEKRDRLGHYYMVRWEGPEGRGAEPVRLVFEFRQAVSGAEVHRMERELPGTEKGSMEFRVTGSQYLERGRVLAWRLRFYRGDELVETRRSYLWK